MLKRNLVIVAIISLSFFLTTSAFGQNKKRKQIRQNTTKEKTVSPKPIATNLMKGHEGMQERNVRNFTSTTQPFADGIVQKSKKSSKTLRKPKKPASYTAGGIWVSGDPLTYNRTKRKNSSRKKPKDTRNLLPYVEQENIYRKRKGNK